MFKNRILKKEKTVFFVVYLLGKYFNIKRMVKK